MSEQEGIPDPQGAIGVFPTPDGIGLMVKSGENEVTIVISPDDAGRVVMSLINTSVLVNMNNMTRAAQEQQDVERVRRLIEEGKNLDLSHLKKK